MSLNFHYADLVFILKGKNAYRKWIKTEILRESFRPGQISFIFCTDDYLLEINRKHLNHDYYTDIITFNYNEDNIISGDLFISVDRIRENASSFNVEFVQELKRVMIHGVLHLMGLDDNSPELKRMIHLRENEALSRFPKL